MKNDQKLLLVTGIVLALVCALYIAMASIPSTAATAVLFPLSILGFFFGLAFILWGIIWIILEKTGIKR